MISYLQILIYILLAILIIIGIILGIKLIITMNKAEKLVDDIQEKVSSLDFLFDAVTVTSSKITGIYSKLTDIVLGAINKFLTKKGRKDIDEDE